jgi:hypothetical protein
MHNNCLPNPVPVPDVKNWIKKKKKKKSFNTPEKKTLKENY